MRLNRYCPHQPDCKASNEKMDALWRYSCPTWVGVKKTAAFDQCMRYEEHESVQRDSRTAGEHPEEV